MGCWKFIPQICLKIDINVPDYMPKTLSYYKFGGKNLAIFETGLNRWRLNLFKDFSFCLHMFSKKKQTTKKLRRISGEDRPWYFGTSPEVWRSTQRFPYKIIYGLFYDFALVEAQLKIDLVWQLSNYFDSSNYAIYWVNR
jgi:hypothetical protein